MKLPSCISCELLVLGLEGQFSKLDSLYVDGTNLPAGTAGWWHASCLASSDAALPWYEARLQNFRDVRGFRTVAEYSHWTIVQDPSRGKRLAFGRSGELLSLSRGNRKQSRIVEGGRIYSKTEDEYHLELDDVDLVQTIQQRLLADGSYPLPAVLEGMGITDRIVHAEALERGVFRFEKELHRHWGKRFVSVRAEYGVFVPAELESHVGPFVR